MSTEGTHARVLYYRLLSVLAFCGRKPLRYILPNFASIKPATENR